MPTPIGTAEATDLIAHAVSVKVAGMSDKRDRAGAQALGGLPAGYLPAGRGKLAVEGAIDMTDVSVEFSATGTAARVHRPAAPSLVDVRADVDRDAIVWDLSEHHNLVAAVADNGGMTDVAWSAATELARRLGQLHRKTLVRNWKRFNTVVGATGNWNSSSAALSNPATNSATDMHAVFLAAFRRTKGDAVIMPQDVFDALCDSPSLKKKIHGQGESDKLLDRGMLEDYLTSVAAVPDGRRVRMVVDSFTYNPKDADYIIGDWLLVLRGASSGASVGRPASSLDGLEREEAAAGLFCTTPTDPLAPGGATRGLSLAALPADKGDGRGLTDRQREMLFGFRYKVNDTQYVSQDQVWHQLHSSYGLKIWDADGGELITTVAGRS